MKNIIKIWSTLKKRPTLTCSIRPKSPETIFSSCDTLFKLSTLSSILTALCMDFSERSEKALFAAMDKKNRLESYLYSSRVILVASQSDSVPGLSSRGYFSEYSRSTDFNFLNLSAYSSLKDSRSLDAWACFSLEADSCSTFFIKRAFSSPSRFTVCSNL